MAKKTTKLSVVQTPTKSQEELEQARWHHDSDRWKELENQWRITPAEVRQRVLALRDELERYRLQLEGAAFGIASGDGCEPPSLDGGDRKFTLYLATDVNPIVAKLFEEIDRFAQQYGPAIYRAVDFNSKLFDLRDHSIETGFKIGLLAGVILSGAPKEVVDRYERGLAFAMQSDHRVVKD